MKPADSTRANRIRSTRTVAILAVCILQWLASGRLNAEGMSKIYHVSGAVWLPGPCKFSINQQVTVGFLIGACGGFARGADTRGVVVMHQSKDGKMSVRLVDVQAELEGRSRNAVIVQDGDYIHVPAKGEKRDKPALPNDPGKNAPRKPPSTD